MRTLFRNPSFMRQTLLLCGLSVLASIVSCLLINAATSTSDAAGAAPGALAALCTLASCGLIVIAFCAVSHRRYREICRLASEIDRMLHGERAIRLSDYREGDLSMLSNEVGKVCARLSKTAEDLGHEKAFLAEALADISHQIRTPLTAAELLVPVIARAKNENERSIRLRELESLLDRVSWLVTSLLKMARVDAGIVRIASARHEIKPVIERAVAPLELAMDMREVRCLIDIKENARFEGDPAWTAEAVANIVKNSMERTPSGGAVRIEAREDAVACRIVIQDDGPGISLEDLPHIFERFYRGSAPQDGGGALDDFENAMEPAGFGIGLALAQSLVNAQGGSIRAGNGPQGGARFEITFPKMTI